VIHVHRLSDSVYWLSHLTSCQVNSSIYEQPLDGWDNVPPWRAERLTRDALTVNVHATWTHKAATRPAERKMASVPMHKDINLDQLSLKSPPTCHRPAILVICSSRCHDNRASVYDLWRQWWVNDRFSALSCVYRLEELVAPEQALLPDQCQASAEDGDQWEDELISNQHPQATSPLLRASYAATWTGCCDWLRGARG